MIFVGACCRRSVKGATFGGLLFSWGQRRGATRIESGIKGLRMSMGFCSDCLHCTLVNCHVNVRMKKKKENQLTL